MDGLPLFDNENCQQKLEILHQAKADHIASLKSIHEALSQFCQEKGVDVDKINKWIGCVGVCDNLEEYLNSDIVPDNDFTDFIKEKFLNIWDDFVK